MIILYADDDKDDRDLFHQVVQQIDPSYTVIPAEDGVQALKLLSQKGVNKPDIIFLDINMPLMDGFETLVEIRKDKRYRQTKVILYSTGNIPKLLDAYKSFNVEFINKHDNIIQIRQSIESVIVRKI